MLQLIYILAFTVIASLAITNLFRSLFTLGIESQRSYSRSTGYKPTRQPSAAHPELLDETGNVVSEPLMVMRSVTVEDAREQLDALYNASPGGDEARGEA